MFLAVSINDSPFDRLEPLGEKSCVSADSRFRKDDPAANLGELIVDAVPKCLTPVRAMIDAHDRYFGEGSGEEFFMGAYLDALPDAVTKAIEKGGAAAGPAQMLDAK